MTETEDVPRMIRSLELIQTIQNIYRAEDKSCILIGGVAAISWGSNRATHDIDLAVYVGDATTPYFILKRAYPNHEHLIYRGGDGGGDPFLSTTTLEAPDCFPIQILNFDYRQEHGKAIGLALENSILKQIHGVTLDVCSLEHLIAIKILAGGTRDHQDVDSLLQANHETVDLEVVKNILEKVKRSDLFDRFFTPNND